MAEWLIRIREGRWVVSFSKVCPHLEGRGRQFERVSVPFSWSVTIVIVSPRWRHVFRTLNRMDSIVQSKSMPWVSVKGRRPSFNQRSQGYLMSAISSSSLRSGGRSFVHVAEVYPMEASRCTRLTLVGLPIGIPIQWLTLAYLPILIHRPILGIVSWY